MNTPEPILDWLATHGFIADRPCLANAKGQHALIVAAQQGRADIVERLLINEAELNVTDLYGNNALWAACFSESVACIDILLAAGIDIDYQNASGATALTYASSSGRHAIVAHLLQAGANPLLTTQDDFSALDLAANRQCLRLLRDAVAGLATT